MPEVSEGPSKKELVNPQQIAVITGTFYPSWRPKEARQEIASEDIRGDLAIATLNEAKNKQFQLGRL